MSAHLNISHPLPKAYMLITMMLAAVSVLSAKTRVTQSDSVSAYFRLDKAYLDLDYGQNAARLDSCLNAIRPLTISGMEVIGAASPEGNAEHNRKLSAQRAATLAGYISRYGMLPDSLVRVSAIGGDYAGLRNMVTEDMSVPGRAEALAALDRPDSDISMARLMEIEGGRAYGYISRNMFPDLRKATLIVEYSRPSVTAVYAKIADMPLRADMASPADTCISIITLASVGEWHAPRYMALKTNMLYDLAAVPNISFEYYIGRNWSVSAQWLGAWWSRNSRHRYWRVYGGGLEARRWFGTAAAAKPLTGHHVGIYAGAVTFDFEWDGDGYMGGLPHGTIFDRCLLTGGVEYGYSLPVAKRINIDFSIGIGYFGGKYIKYSPMYGHYYKDSEMKLNYFGPTKAEVSLVWLLGRGNRNR